MVRFIAARKHLFLLLFYPLVGLGFALCEAQVTTARYIMEWSAVDRAIPFVPWMVAPYVFWYLAVAFPFVWLGVRDGPAFTRYTWFVYGGMVSTYVLYFLFPNGQTLRPALESLGTGWDGQLVSWIYTHDTPLNVNPSIHVIDTLAVWIALTKDKVLSSLRGFPVVLAVVCLSIIASTVLIKQHSILDVFGGLVWSALWYFIVYFLPTKSFRFRRP